MDRMVEKSTTWIGPATTPTTSTALQRKSLAQLNEEKMQTGFNETQAKEKSAS